MSCYTWSDLWMWFKGLRYWLKDNVSVCGPRPDCCSLRCSPEPSGCADRALWLRQRRTRRVQLRVSISLYYFLISENLSEAYYFCLIYRWETSDGSKHEEQGQLKNQGAENESLAVQGQYSWVGPDNVLYTVKYIADENGFQPQIEQGPGGSIPPGVVASLLG